MVTAYCSDVFPALSAHQARWWPLSDFLLPYT